jgi:imidazolonepropionase
MISVDLLVKNIGQLVNPADDRVARGDAANQLRVARNVCVAGAGERIAFIGPEAELERACRLDDDAQVIDASGMVAMAGFVDPHTHLPFAGTRQDEFQKKLQGVSYQEIAAAGGGIRRTVAQTRAMNETELVSLCERRLDEMLLDGATTIEAKSGYGLDRAGELKQLEALQAVRALHPVDIVSTFMGAHEIPDEYRGRNRDFLDFLVRDLAPEVKRRQLAEFADIFCEDGYFSVPEADGYLRAMAGLGFGLKMHADEFTSNGAAALAAELGARSAEHLIALSDDEIDRLAPSDTACVLLPGVSFFMRLNRWAPARRILEKGGIVALGSDFNPGSSMISSMLFVFWLGIFQLGLTIEEALNAVTINAAYAVGREDRCGSLAPGKTLDLLLLDIPDYEYLAYHPGGRPVHTVIKSGEVVISGGKLTFRD